jgi:hypothetical protein
LTTSGDWRNLSAVSKWDDHSVLDHVLTALGDVPIVNLDGHHFGRPWMTAYQLAIKVDALAPQIAQQLEVTVGGQGIGQHTSLAQYLARQLSGYIKQHGHNYPVEGAFLSNDLIDAVVLKTPTGQKITSSVTHSGYDLSLYRLRRGTNVE